jgi:hypothetical protein
MIKEHKFKTSIENEIINNENTKTTHLYIKNNLNFQVHLIPRVKQYLLNLKFLRCNTSINNNVLIGLGRDV